MKKTKLLLFFLITSVFSSQAQCVNDFPYPFDAVASTNSGASQQITDCSYGNTYAEINNLIIGTDYIFSCESSEAVQRFITVTDLNNNVITSGVSPLTVPSVANTSLRAHYELDATCTDVSDCNISTITAVFSCPPPRDILITGVTTTSATFGWTPGESESSWEVLVLTAGSTPPDASTSGNTALFNPYSTSALAPSSNYEFYIRANCGSEYSPWAGPFNFASGCPPISEINENFDTTPDNELPLCWTEIIQTSVSPASSFVEVIIGEVAINNFDSEVASIILASPKLSNLGDGTHRLKFKARGGVENQTLQVGTLNAVNGDAIFTSFQDVDLTINNTEYIVDFATYTGTDTFIGIKNTSGQFYSVYVDDVIWELSPACPDVSSIIITATTTNSANISWVPGGAQTQWDVVFGDLSVTDPDTLTPISPAPSGTPEATLTGLTDNTDYKVWVRTVCGDPDGNGAWIGPITFKTQCLATDGFNENFDTTSGAELADCWSSVLNGTGLDEVSSFVLGSDFTFNSPSRSVQMNNGGSFPTANVILVSPNLSNLSDGTHRLKLYARAFSNSSIQVGTLDTNTNAAVFTPLQTISITSSYVEYVIDFTVYAGTDTYIGFRHNATNAFDSIFIDDVKWETAPLCGDVLNVNVVGISPNDATINWTASSTGETAWDVVYGDSAATDPDVLTPISPAPSGTPEASITGLTSNTAYNLWVRSVCGDPNGNGNWIGPLSFTTPCDAIDVFNENFDTTNDGELPECWTKIVTGPTVSNFANVSTVSYNSNSPDKAVEINNDSSGASDYVMLVSPNINTLSSGLYRLKFYAKTNFGAGSIEVGTLDSNIANGTFTPFQSVNASESYSEYIIDFETYTGTDTYIALRNSSDSYNSVYVDDVIWQLSPLCPDVSNIAVNDVTSDSASVTWTAGDTEPNWQVVFSESNVTDPSTLTPSAVLNTTSFELTSLTDNTSYNVWVRSVCGTPNGDGNWIGPVNFNTDCLPATLISEDFEVSAAIPDCWNVIINGAGASDFAYVQSNQFIANSGTNSIELYNYDSATTANIVLVLPQVSNLNSGANVLKFFARSYDASSIQIGTLDSASETATFTNFQTVAITDAFQEYEVDFTGYSGSDMHIGIRHNSSNTFNSIFIDDVSWDTNLSVSENNENEFKYYPNPVRNELYLNSNSTILNVEVYNVVGQKLIDSSINAPTAILDMSLLVQGYYILKVKTTIGTVKVIRVLKQ